MSSWSLCEEVQLPERGVAQVYFLPRLRYGFWLERAEGLLSASERRHAEGLTHALIRDRFVLTRGALRSILSVMLNEEEGRREFDRGEKGKPLLSHGGLHFNLSHSRDCSVLCFSQDAEVGVDVETVHRVVNMERMMARFFHEEERAWWRVQEDLDRAFIVLWTRKEAFLKRSGVGVSVSLATVNTVDGVLSRSLINLYPDNEHVVAVALNSEGTVIEPCTWVPPCR